MTTRIKLTHSKYLHEDEVKLQVCPFRNFWWTLTQCRYPVWLAERMAKQWARLNHCGVVDGRVER